MWNTTNGGKFLKRQEYQTTLPVYVGHEATVRIGHGTAYWFKIRRVVRQACIMSPYLFNLHADYIKRTARLDESQAGI